MIRVMKKKMKVLKLLKGQKTTILSMWIQSIVLLIDTLSAAVWMGLGLKRRKRG